MNQQQVEAWLKDDLTRYALGIRGAMRETGASRKVVNAARLAVADQQGGRVCWGCGHLRPLSQIEIVRVVNGQPVRGRRCIPCGRAQAKALAEYHKTYKQAHKDRANALRKARRAARRALIGAGISEAGND